MSRHFLKYRIFISLSAKCWRHVCEWKKRQPTFVYWLTYQSSWFSNQTRRFQRKDYCSWADWSLQGRPGDTTTVFHSLWATGHEGMVFHYESDTTVTSIAVPGNVQRECHRDCEGNWWQVNYIFNIILCINNNNSNNFSF